MSKKMKEIEVCPNCGLKLTGQEFLPNIEKVPQQVGLDIDPIAGRFLCPQCDYSGLPILVNESQYSKLKFANKKVGLPLTRMNPAYAKLLVLLFGLVLVTFIVSPPWSFYLTILLLISIIYVAMKIPKYRADLETSTQGKVKK